MPTIRYLPNSKSSAGPDLRQSVTTGSMSEPSKPQASASAEKKNSATRQKNEPSPRRTDPAPLPTMTMVGGPNDPNNSSAFRGRVSRRGGHASQRTGPTGSSTTTRASKRSTPPAPLNDTRTTKKRSTKKKASNKSPVTADSKRTLPPAGWELIRNILLPRTHPSDPTSSFGLGIRPDQNSERVMVRSDYRLPTTTKTPATTPKPCKYPQKGDIILAVNGQTVFDVHTMHLCNGFSSMRQVAELMRNTEDGKPLQLDLLRPSTIDASCSAPAPAVPARSQDEESAMKTSVVADSSGRSLPQKDTEVLKEDDADNTDDADDARRWKGTEEFLLATCADAKAAVDRATFKHDRAIGAVATSIGGEDAAAAAAAVMTAEHNKFVDAVNGSLAQIRREVDLGLAKLRDEASRYQEATLNRNREAARYRTLIAGGAGGQDGAVAQRVEILDKAIEEKRQAKREYQRLIAAVGDKETMVQVIEERRRQLDAALMQSSRAASDK